MPMTERASRSVRSQSAMIETVHVGHLRGYVVAGALCVTGVVGALAATSQASGSQASRAAITRTTSNNHAAHAALHCPWVSESLHHQASPASLAGQVLSKMTLAQKAGFVVLKTYPPLENSNLAIPSLCIPALTLSDGPNGVANGLTGVTQLPAAIGVAASFNPALARATGQVMAQETRAKGIATVQGPELNLARVPQSGRIFETYGEDPYLTSVLGVASIEGIQSTGEMANAKHVSAYTQETARLLLNQVVPPRPLAELYNAPFKAAVQQAHVASVMCSYGSLNGVNICSDPYLYATLKSWGFTGFVRSDLGAVRNVAQALRAGIALVKPASAPVVVRMVRAGTVSTSDLNRAAKSVLTRMFAFGMIAHPVSGSLLANTTTPAHTQVALTAAEQSVVLLKNQASVLPLAKTITSVAVIGASAQQSPQVSGGGSSAVRAPFVVTPLQAIRSSLGRNVRVSYSPGGPASLDLDTLSDVEIVSGTPLKLITPLKAAGAAGKSDISIELNRTLTAAAATASQPGTGEGWSHWRFKVRAKKSGIHEVSMQETGDTWLYLNGHLILASPGVHAPTDMATTVKLRAGHTYSFSARFYEEKGHAPPKFGIVNVTPQINAAVAAARSAKAAIIFAGSFSTEGGDSAGLNLPGDANALISAVAAVNSHTIVVLNTGNAVLMPWLRSVAAVVEAWYPGEQDGAAIAAVLSGAVDPSGRLPITFPTSSTAQPMSSPQLFPGVDLTVNFGTGLDVGYRWYQANGVKPLFPFGFGLDYTSFKLSHATLKKTSSGVTVKVTVSNTGTRSGADVVQAYVKYPSLAGEPPEQLRAFNRVVLRPSSSRTITMAIPSSGFTVFKNGSFTTVAGSYGIDIGQSSADLSVHLNVNLR